MIRPGDWVAGFLIRVERVLELDDDVRVVRTKVDRPPSNPNGREILVDASSFGLGESGTPADVLANAQRVYQQVVVTRIMPLGNTTGMTDEERAVIAAWVRGGAKPE